MSQFKKLFKTLLVAIFAITSLANMSLLVPQVAKAADPCSLDSGLFHLAIIADQGTDPLTRNVGQITKYWAQIQDSSGTPAWSSCTTYISIGFDNSNVIKTNSSGTADPRNISISATTGSTQYTRASFYIKGITPGSTAITAETTTGSNSPSQQLQSGVQTVNIVAPAPVSDKLVFNDVAHGNPDSVSGIAGALPSLSGIKARAYSDLALTNQIGTDVDVNSIDGSFPAIETGDDQYRTVFIVAVYNGTTLSAPTVVTQNYPSEVALTVNRVNSDVPVLTWTNFDAGNTFVIYRSDLAHPALTQIGTSLTPTFTDTTANPEIRYTYAVKQVNAAGSYTPEFLPTQNIRIDITNVNYDPARINVQNASTKPAITANVTPTLASVWSTAITASWTNNATQVTTLATVTINGNNLTATLPATLPDGNYTVSIVARDTTLDIDDAVTISNNYLIDTVAPTAPVLSNLRFSNGIISGVINSVEKSIYVNIYDASHAIVAQHIVAGSDGSFISAGLLASDKYYIEAEDFAENVSPQTLFDVTHAPFIDSSKITMQQNVPGTSDKIIGAIGSVTPGITVKIYGSDPALTNGLVPIYQTIANSDGSFTREVGDNLANTFWVTVWSGSNLESAAVKLANTISINPPTSFTAKAGNGSVTLNWTPVLGAEYYLVNVYDVTTKNNVAAVTISGLQTTWKFVGENSHTYRFYVKAQDSYGNVSAYKEVEATPTAPVVAATIKQTTHTTTAATAKPIAAEEIVASPSPASTPTPTNNDTGKNWTGWIIGLGIIILGIALSAAYLLWGKPVETVIVTKKPSIEPTPAPKAEKIANNDQLLSDSVDVEKKDDVPPKPRW